MATKTTVKLSEAQTDIMSTLAMVKGGGNRRVFIHNMLPKGTRDAMVKKGLITVSLSDNGYYVTAELTDAGRAYAQAQGWLPSAEPPCEHGIMRGHCAICTPRPDTFPKREAEPTPAPDSAQAVSASDVLSFICLYCGEKGSYDNDEHAACGEPIFDYDDSGEQIVVGFTARNQPPQETAHASTPSADDFAADNVEALMSQHMAQQIASVPEDALYTINAQNARIEALELENAKLRAALEAIATHPGLYSRNDDFSAGYNRGMTVLTMIAKNALEAAKGD